MIGDGGVCGGDLKGRLRERFISSGIVHRYQAHSGSPILEPVEDGTMDALLDQRSRSRTHRRVDVSIVLDVPCGCSMMAMPSSRSSIGDALHGCMDGSRESIAVATLIWKMHERGPGLERKSISACAEIRWLVGFCMCAQCGDARQGPKAGSSPDRLRLAPNFGCQHFCAVGKRWLGEKYSRREPDI